MSLRVFAHGDPVHPVDAQAIDQAGLGSLLKWTAQGPKIVTPGVVAINGDLWVALPRPLIVPADNALTRTVFPFIAAMARYQRDPKRTSVDRADGLLHVGTDTTTLSTLEAALLLHTDHQKHGPLLCTETHDHVDQPGRIHWARSLRIGHPLNDAHGTRFVHLATRRIRARRDHPLTRLHEATVAHIARQLDQPAMTPAQTLPATTDCLRILDQHQRRHFGDRHRQVITWLQTWHRGDGGSGQQRQSINGWVVRRFEYLWERMLQVALGHTSLSIKLRGHYHLPDGSTQPGLSLRPDQIMHHSSTQTCVVVDAKDYAPGRWPGTGDLSKQALYQDLVARHLKTPVGNAFVFPTADPGVSLRGTHRSALPDAKFHIVGLSVSLIQVMQAYCAGRRRTAPVACTPPSTTPSQNWPALAGSRPPTRCLC